MWHVMRGMRCGLLLGAVAAMVSLPAHAQQGGKAPAADTEQPSGAAPKGEAESAAGETNGADGEAKPAAGETNGSKGETGGSQGETGGPQGGTGGPQGETPSANGGAVGSQGAIGGAAGGAPRPGPLTAPPVRPEPLRIDDDDEGVGMRDPAYFVSGVITLSIAGAFAAGGVVALATDDTERPPLPEPGEMPAQVEQPQTATGLVGFAVGNAVLGVPLLLLGGASERPNSPEMVAAGTALATAGVAVAGAGAVIGVNQASYVDTPLITGSYDTDAGPIALPITLGIAGAVAIVGGIIVWSFGAGEADDEQQEERAQQSQPFSRPSLELTAGAGTLSLLGQF